MGGGGGGHDMYIFQNENELVLFIFHCYKIHLHPFTWLSPSQAINTVSLITTITVAVVPSFHDGFLKIQFN